MLYIKSLGKKKQTNNLLKDLHVYMEADFQKTWNNSSLIYFFNISVWIILLLLLKIKLLYIYTAIYKLHNSVVKTLHCGAEFKISHGYKDFIQSLLSDSPLNHPVPFFSETFWHNPRKRMIWRKFCQHVVHCKYSVEMHAFQQQKFTHFKNNFNWIFNSWQINPLDSHYCQVSSNIPFPPFTYDN